MTRPKIPDGSSIEELAQFWDTHDATDFLDELEEVTEPIFVRSKIYVETSVISRKRQWMLSTLQWLLAEEWIFC